MVIAVDPRNTSRRCHACGHVAAQNRKDPGRIPVRLVRPRRGRGRERGPEYILAAGLAVIACGETAQPGRSMKQEPTVSEAA
jgi:putative transposase